MCNQFVQMPTVSERLTQDAMMSCYKRRLYNTFLFHEDRIRMMVGVSLLGNFEVTCSTVLYGSDV